MTWASIGEKKFSASKRAVLWGIPERKKPERFMAFQVSVGVLSNVIRTRQKNYLRRRKGRFHKAFRGISALDDFPCPKVVWRNQKVKLIFETSSNPIDTFLATEENHKKAPT